MLGRAASLALRSLASGVALLAAAGAAQAQTAANPPTVAEAEPEALIIDWQGPEDCERGDAVRTKVLRLLGGSQKSLIGGTKVTVTVRRDKRSRYVAVLETATAAGGGSKRLEGESCDAIALASSVVIALSLDPNASLDAEPPEAEPEPKPKPKREPKPYVAPKPRPAPKRDTFPYLYGSVGVLFELLDIPSAFTAAGAGVRHRRFSIELGGAVYQPRDLSLADKPQVGAELKLFTAELLGCYAVLPFELGDVELCPGFRLEHLTATARGVSNPDQAKVVLAAGVGALRGRLRATSWLSATLDAGAALRPFQPTFVLLGVGDVFEIPAFSPFARTGLALEF
ncbi:MAG TPA: hypothetical protein VHP33_23750 [Polyangiaceae bacterium]|nr:hypothetical protein [Polyangiaceae bacterium]